MRPRYTLLRQILDLKPNPTVTWDPLLIMYLTKSLFYVHTKQDGWSILQEKISKNEHRWLLLYSSWFNFPTQLTWTLLKKSSLILPNWIWCWNFYIGTKLRHCTRLAWLSVYDWYCFISSVVTSWRSSQQRTAWPWSRVFFWGTISLYQHQ